MDPRTARALLNRDLEAMAERRSRAQTQIDELGLQIGATATFLREELGQPKVKSAEHAHLSPTHMTELMRTAAEERIAISDPLERVPFLRGQELQAYVADHGGARRVIASFADADSFWLSGLSPDCFRHRDYHHSLRLPPMLIQMRDDEWVAVDNVKVGYGGTGGSNALRELKGMGLDPDLARRIAYSRVSNVDLDRTETGMHTHEWPQVHLEAPTPVGDFYVARLFAMAPADPEENDDQHVNGEDPTSGGFYPTASRTPALTTWLAMLDNAPPSWLRGTRRARVYLSRDLAEADGFTFTSYNFGWPDQATYPVIIEQGRIQLWLSVPTSNDPTVLFTPEMYAALGQAGFYVDDRRGQDDKSKFWRWLRTYGTQRPPYVDLDNSPLVHSPA